VKYVLFLTQTPGDGPQEGTPEFDAEMRRWNELTDELRAAGRLVAVTGLNSDSATTVRAPGGDLTVTDGPYAETKEILFSFYVVDVEDLDAAVAIARKAPSADYGAVDIRPVIGFEMGGVRETP
jgi:hypothetical protein